MAAAKDLTLVYGPQGEAVIVPNAEVRNWNATPPEKRGTVVYGPQGEVIRVELRTVETE
jgi:hypothetical protein